VQPPRSPQKSVPLRERCSAVPLALPKPPVRVALFGNKPFLPLTICPFEICAATGSLFFSTHITWTFRPGLRSSRLFSSLCLLIAAIGGFHNWSMTPLRTVFLERRPPKTTAFFPRDRIALTFTFGWIGSMVALVRLLKLAASPFHLSGEARGIRRRVSDTLYAPSLVFTVFWSFFAGDGFCPGP